MAGGIVRDDRELLRMMLQDSERQSDVWRPQSGWRDYALRVRRVIDESGLADFRTNQNILKGYDAGGVPVPTKPVAAWKRAVWNALEAAPVFRDIVGEYQRLLRARHKSQTRNEIFHAKRILEQIAGKHPDLHPPKGLTNGSADDGFLWRGHEISAAWVQYLSRAGDLYTAATDGPISRIMEIGPGLGHSTLAHVTLNPHLRTIVNIDIPPILYVSTQYLKSIPDVEVVDYRETRDQDPIDISGESGGRPRIYQIAPWQLARIEGTVDVLLNAASFQEMNREVCENYAKHCVPLTDRCVLLHAGDPRKPAPDIEVTPQFLVGLYRGKFPDIRSLDSGWCDSYDTNDYVATLLRRPAA